MSLSFLLLLCYVNSSISNLLFMFLSKHSMTLPLNMLTSVQDTLLIPLKPFLCETSIIPRVDYLANPTMDSAGIWKKADQLSVLNTLNICRY